MGNEDLRTVVLNRGADAAVTAGLLRYMRFDESTVFGHLLDCGVIAEVALLTDGGLEVVEAGRKIVDLQFKEIRPPGIPTGLIVGGRRRHTEMLVERYLVQAAFLPTNADLTFGNVLRRVVIPYGQLVACAELVLATSTNIPDMLCDLLVAGNIVDEHLQEGRAIYSAGEPLEFPRLA